MTAFSHRLAAMLSSVGRRTARGRAGGTVMDSHEGMSLPRNFRRERPHCGLREYRNKHYPPTLARGHQNAGCGQCFKQWRPHVATVLDKELKRQITIDGVDYAIALDPEGIRLIGKGKRRPEV